MRNKRQARLSVGVTKLRSGRRIETGEDGLFAGPCYKKDRVDRSGDGAQRERERERDRAGRAATTYPISSKAEIRCVYFLSLLPAGRLVLVYFLPLAGSLLLNLFTKNLCFRADGIRCMSRPDEY